MPTLEDATSAIIEKPSAFSKLKRGANWLITAIGTVLIIGCVFAFGDLIAIFIHWLSTGSWKFTSVSDELARFGQHPRGRIWAMPASAGWFILTCAYWGMVSDMERPAPVKSRPTPRTEKRPMRLPRFLWPRSPKVETTVLSRLGRAIHWLSVAIAAIALAIGIGMGWASISQSISSHQRAQQWDLAHPNGQVGDSYDYRPFEVDSYFWGASLGGMAAGFIIAIGGRGLRYILAGE